MTALTVTARVTDSTGASASATASADVGAATVPAGFSPFWTERWLGSVPDPTKWSVRHDEVFGADGNRIGRDRRENVTCQPASSGRAGRSVLLQSKREVFNGNDFTCGEMRTRDVGFYLPRYFRLKASLKLPMGKAQWSAFWFTARLGGAGMWEWDGLEGFPAQIPGRITQTMHRTDNGGVYRANLIKSYGGIPYEAPSYTPGWHDLVWEVTPTDPSADPNAPASNVTFRSWLDGAPMFWGNGGGWAKTSVFNDTSALYGMTNGGSADSFWNVWIQGCQIGGTYEGHPDDALGYSRWGNRCTVSGTPPNSCATSYQGVPIMRADWSTVAGRSMEIGEIEVLRYTG